MNKKKLEDYRLKGSVHTVEIKSAGVAEAPQEELAECITSTTQHKKTGEAVTKSIINPNKLTGDVFGFREFTTPLHAAIHKIKKIVLLEGGKIQEYKNPLDLVYDTGLTLEEILLANKGKKKPLKSEGGYTVYDIKGYLIGFQYYPQKDKRKK